MDNLEIGVPGLFLKSRGVPFNVDLSATASPKEAKLDHLTVKFFNAEIKTTGTLTQLDADPAGKVNPVASLAVESNEIDFKPWVDLVPMLKSY
jgi:hypothetical protein